MAGLGGDGFWLIADGDGTVNGINASGPAGSQATREYYADRGDEEIPTRGSAAALTVPGAVDGWRLAHTKYGQLPWERLFEDAIAFARQGVAMTANFTQWISRDVEILRQQAAIAKMFLTDGEVPEVGTLLKQPTLGTSLETVAQLGPREGFYDGPIAEQFCDGLGEASPLTPMDFEQYAAEWVAPLSVEYRDVTAYSLPPNTQGIAALQILRLLDYFDVGSWGDGTADFYHYMTEVVKLAFADRDAWVTDPEAVDVPVEKLFAGPYLDTRRERIDSATVLPAPVEPGIAPAGGTPEPQNLGGDTCYLSVVDDQGLAVSMIQSIYFDFGSGILAGETGIIPQNRGAFFSLDPCHINSLEPGKRTFHTLIPGILTRDDQPYLVYGTMGGEGQPQTQAAIVSRIIDFGYDVQQAIEAPRWLYGRTWGEESKSLSLEGRIPDSVAAELQRRGHPVTMVRDVDETMGHAAAIKIHDNGVLEGGADPRGDGASIGY